LGFLHKNNIFLIKIIKLSGFSFGTLSFIQPTHLTKPYLDVFPVFIYHMEGKSKIPLKIPQWGNL